MSRSLDIAADLSLTHDGEEIAVWDDDDHLVVDAPSFTAVRALTRTATSAPTPALGLSGMSDSPSGDVDAVLDSYDLSVEVRVRYATVARLGGDAVATGWRRRLAERVFGVPAGVRIRGCVVAMARRVG